MSLPVQGKMITVLFLYRPLAWCFLRGVKYIIPLIIFLVLVIPSEYLGFSSLIAFGLWMMDWSYRTAKKGFYRGTNEYGADMGIICKDKKPLTFWGCMVTVGGLGLGLVILGLKAIIRDFL